ncbi:MAG: hypothetical protein NUW01_02130 [Gemmatimonadaceae bacterium]|nr:hypothetical protein [Gemmatimonadaceae bacterium]
MANKIQRTVYLSPTIWAQIDDLINYFGDNQHDVLTHVLNDWLSRHQTEVTEMKRRVRSLRPKIAKIIREEGNDGVKRGGKRHRN